MRSALLVILVIGLFSCDPCSDCGPYQREMKVELKFINLDSLNLMTDSLKVLDTLIKYNDSLRAVDASINEGETGLEDIKMELEDFIDSLTPLRTMEGFRAYLISNRKEVNSILTLLEKGNVLLNEISYLNHGTSETFEKASTSYSIPLSYTDETSSYNVDIAWNSIYQFTVTYELHDEIDVDRKVARRASDISVSESSFISSDLTCEESVCVDGTTEITFYY